MLGSFTGTFKFGRRRRISLLPAGYVTIAGLTIAPMTTGGTYAQSQAFCAAFTGLGFAAGTWRAATIAEIISIATVLSWSDSKSIYGWAYSSHPFNIWSSESGQIINFNTADPAGTSNTNMFNILCVKAAQLDTNRTVNILKRA